MSYPHQDQLAGATEALMQLGQALRGDADGGFRHDVPTTTLVPERGCGSPRRPVVDRLVPYPGRKLIRGAVVGVLRLLRRDAVGAGDFPSATP
jgi:hypothetical protein